MTKFRPVLLFTAVFAGGASLASADTVAYWNFNDLSISSAALPGTGGVPTTINATSGPGTLSLAGWAGTVDDFAGSTLGAQGSDLSGASLSLVAGGSAAPFPGNGSYLDISVDLTGYADFEITFATRGTSTGFDTGAWSYSINGGEFTTLAGVNTATRSTSYTSMTASFTGLSDAAMTFRYTLSGATGSSGNNRIDNLVISAAAIADAPIPEPSSWALLAGVTAVGFAILRRRRAG